jgi:hypothetical protein
MRLSPFLDFSQSNCLKTSSLRASGVRVASRFARVEVPSPAFSDRPFWQGVWFCRSEFIETLAQKRFPAADFFDVLFGRDLQPTRNHIQRRFAEK